MNIIVADRQDRVRFALRILLERMLGQKVMGEASNASELSILAARTNPDILLLEWELPGLEAAAGLQELLQLHPKLMVIVTSSASGARQAALDAEQMHSSIKPLHPRRCWKQLAPVAVRPLTGVLR